MDFKLLSNYPKISDTLSEEFRALILMHMAKNKATRPQYLLNLYSSFLDIINLKNEHTERYSGLDILNDADAFYQQSHILIGFIHVEGKFSLGRKIALSCSVKHIFSGIAKNKGLYFPAMRWSSIDMIFIEKCIKLYHDKDKNITKLAYYNGWSAVDKEGNNHNLSLAKVYDSYGRDFTKLIQNTLQVYIRTQKIGSAGQINTRLISLLNNFTELRPNLLELKVALEPQNMTRFFLEILNLRLGRVVHNGESTKHFLSSKWPCIVRYYTDCFVRGGLFEEPIHDLITPAFKASKTKMSVSEGGLHKKQSVRLLTNIPLSITDSQAIERIFERVNRDIDHVRVVSQQLVDKIIYRHERNQELLKIGVVKPLSGNHCGATKYPDGLENLANTLATFNHYRFGFDGSKHNKYLLFLGCLGKSELLRKELNLPTIETIIPFLVQLVLEHPKLTPAWFIGWRLFSKNGDQIGFKQSGEQYVIVSNKERRGAHLAEQIIILTEHSKHIVESLISHTQLAREELKKQGCSDWRYMLITATGLSSKPKKVVQIATTRKEHKQFQNAFIAQSISRDGQVILSESESRDLADAINLRNVRSSRAVQVYLETYSVDAMVEALGHAKYTPDLLSRYLPDVILEYFNSRWVRIFQNAIIYEAMKDSPYLLDAVDLSPDELDRFLLNHSLGPLPEHIKKGKEVASSINREPNAIRSFDEIIVMLSVPLLQMLIAISNIVEKAQDGETLPEICEKWYETAVFIINHLTISTNGKSKCLATASALPFLEEAKLNPLNVHKIKDALCR